MRGPQPQAGGDHAERGARGVGRREILLERGIVEIETAAGPAAIAFLRHGQADDRHGRIGDQRQQRGQRFGREQRAVHRADDARARAVAVALGHRVQMILRGEQVDRMAPPQLDAHDPPAQVALFQHGLRMERLVRAMKRAEAEMDDARADRVPVVTGAARAGRRGAQEIGGG
ncbi:hypothetical protein BAN20980_06611 [Burkholderia anthina]|uniref:Uncharacterized protein n=1 Tax=Burkholderia anthina TaxID=179879 RepID=A0A6P2GJ79_9BURK|nr:hypothetical protein BAN20980_06611 [Burkholderia anthina]